ncbi:MAG: hypothetical protein AAF202_13700 [Pseudomonadota bacterium]
MHSAARLSLVWIASFILCQQALAYKACLYSRSNDQPTGGHAFVTVELGDKVLEAYGLWPRKKHPDGMAINKAGDFPYRFLEARDLITPKLEAMTEGSLCLPTAGDMDLDDVRALAQDYIGTYGEWRFSDNNCAHFAIRLFNLATGHDFPEVWSPKRINRVLARDY